MKNIIGRLFGVRTIGPQDGLSRLASVANSALDVSSGTSSLAGLADKLPSTFASASKVLGKISNIVAVGTTLYNASQNEDVAFNSLVGNLLGDSLNSTSHDNVSALYHYGKGRLESLVSDGKLSFSYDKYGTVLGYKYKQEDLDKIKGELKILKWALED